MELLGFSLVLISLLFGLCVSDDASKYFNMELSYITASPLGVPQQVLYSYLQLVNYSSAVILT